LKTNALIAQSVEQRTENPCVGGSSPPRGTKSFKNKKARALCMGFFILRDLVSWRDSKGKQPKTKAKELLTRESILDGLISEATGL
jgi:hypothetical protein